VQFVCVVCTHYGNVDQEMLCHERVGSWIVINMWWCEWEGSYSITLLWGYERGRFVCSVLAVERCYVRGGT